MVNRHFNPKTYWDLIVSERQLWGFIVPYFTCSHSTGGERATERHCATVRRDADWNYSKQHAWKRKERKKKTNITDRWVFLAFSSLLWITLCYTVLLLYLLPVLSYLVMRYQCPFWCGNVFRHEFAFHCMRKCTSGMRAHGKWELPKTNSSMWGLAVLNKLTRKCYVTNSKGQIFIVK